MFWQKFRAFVDAEDSRLRDKFSYSDDEKMFLSEAVKLGEEVGELNEQILNFCSLQRKEKIGEFDKSALENEFADVFIVVSVLARRMNVDLEKSVEKKMEIIEKRYQ